MNQEPTLDQLQFMMQFMMWKMSKQQEIKSEQKVRDCPNPDCSYTALVPFPIKNCPDCIARRKKNKKVRRK